eukprot:COSAG02_NODE_2475_length_8735_cov_5.368110_5_plen_95_part_00
MKALCGVPRPIKRREFTDLLPNYAYCARLGVWTFHWFSFACNLSLNFFGTDCAQVLNFRSCPNVRNTHGSVGKIFFLSLRVNCKPNRWFRVNLP